MGNPLRDALVEPVFPNGPVVQFDDNGKKTYTNAPTGYKIVGDIGAGPQTYSPINETLKNESDLTSAYDKLYTNAYKQTANQGLGHFAHNHPLLSGLLGVLLPGGAVLSAAAENRSNRLSQLAAGYDANIDRIHKATDRTLGLNDRVQPDNNLHTQLFQAYKDSGLDDASAAQMTLQTIGGRHFTSEADAQNAYNRRINPAEFNKAANNLPGDIVTGANTGANVLNSDTSVQPTITTPNVSVSSTPLSPAPAAAVPSGNGQGLVSIGGGRKLAANAAEAMQIIQSIASQQHPGGLHLNSAYRDPGHNAAVGGAPHSNHLTGNAIDINYADVPWAKPILEAYGFKQLGGTYHGRSEANHFDYVGGTGQAPTSMQSQGQQIDVNNPQLRIGHGPQLPMVPQPAADTRFTIGNHDVDPAVTQSIFNTRAGAITGAYNNRPTFAKTPGEIQAQLASTQGTLANTRETAENTALAAPKLNAQIKQNENESAARTDGVRIQAENARTSQERFQHEVSLASEKAKNENAKQYIQALKDNAGEIDKQLGTVTQTIKGKRSAMPGQEDRYKYLQEQQQSALHLLKVAQQHLGEATPVAGQTNYSAPVGKTQMFTTSSGKTIPLAK